MVGLLVWMGCGLGSEPVDPPTPPAAASEAVPLNDLVEQAVTVAYGAGGMGIATRDAGRVVQFVSLHRHDDHVVYITRGASETEFPHEFVFRIRTPAATSDAPLIEVAPMWPVSLLVEIAEAEKRMGRPFPPRDSLGNITLPGVELPYRNVVFLLDPVLPLVEDAQRTLAFVQVVPFDDADWARMEAIAEGQTNVVLAQRMQPDPLGLVDASP